MKVILTILTMVICAASVWCRDVPAVEVFAGYSYLNIDTNDLTSRQSANGWGSSVSGNFNKWFAAEFDVSGYYKNYGVDLNNVLPGAGTLTVKVTDFSYLAGPRLNFRPLFVHALVGGDRLTGSALGFSASQNSFAGAFGGGAVIPVGHGLAFRASADYVFSRHNIFGGSPLTQNNFRASVGIVFTFGGKRETRSPAPGAQAAPAVQPAVSAQPAVRSESTSLGVVGYATDEGFKITSVRDGSPAAQVFIRGDVIWEIDGKRVRSGQDVDAALAANPGATIKVKNENTIPAVREVKVR